MHQPDKQEIARLVKAGRMEKGYTQQELADLCGLSLRSVQRIENAEVLPRLYTIKILADRLGFPIAATPEIDALPPNHSPVTPKATQLNTARKLILSLASAVLLVLLLAAFVAQSKRFPETDFEWFLLWGFVAAVYAIILFRVWK
jgi:transcriptional regulator with XRE-family HTH domain